MQRPIRVALGAAIALALVMPATAALTGTGKAYDAVAVERLKADTGARLTLSDATGTVRFARATQGRSFGPAGSQKKADHSMSFLMANGKAFGLANARNELKLIGSSKDRIGASRVNFGQVYRGVPVFGATLMTHYDARGNLTVVNGTIVPGIRVNTVPGKSAGEAGAAALRLVPGKGVAVRGSHLMIFREGLAKGVPGANHLAYEVEVGNGKGIREFVYIDAHTGKKIDQITGIFDAMNRRAYDAGGAAAPGPNYPGTPYWSEGDSFPTASTEANNMISASKETYDLFKNAFGRDSFDGAGATMDSIFNRGNSCPNASWNGTYISFCPGLTTDDVTGHEWAHAYTEYTHGLIYAWQPGALNESYSDIWGETVDRINGRMTDVPFAERTADSCSIYGGSLPLTFTVNSPAPIAGNYTSFRGGFGPQSGFVTGNLTLSNDGAGVATDGCSALVGFPAGDIALIDRGTCGFTVKVKNAQNAGASGVVVANTSTANIIMGGADATITIPSVAVNLTVGNLFKANMPVNVTFGSPTPTDNSVRWLLGEDDSAVGLTGPLRDMWNPRCYGNAGKVTDVEYTCSTADGGGVHSNSGVPNHAFSLVVDGGTYNGQSITGIGLTKAAHIYFRAQSVYQGPASDFADHADAIEQSCADLTGVDLTDIQTGAPSGEAIDANDCAQVAKAAIAVQLRTAPTQCNFQPLLDQAPPALCAAGTSPSVFFHDEFESGDAWMDRWTVSRTEVHPGEFVPRDWTVVGDLPADRGGHAFWAPDPNIGACSASGVDNQAGVLHLYSKVISVAKPAKGARIAFDHSVATEAGWDGGNLSISVNGGAWQPVKAVDFVYNDYNATLNAAPGSDNPLAGQKAFSGSDGGSVEGRWGRSIINLAPYAPEGSKVQLRFDLGTDCAGGGLGWYVDDVKMYTCQRKK